MLGLKSLFNFKKTMRNISSREQMAFGSCRILKCEELEQRFLLSVSTVEYDNIRSFCREFDLPADVAQVNCIDLIELTSQALQNAINHAVLSEKDDLILLRTSNTSHVFEFTGCQSNLVIDIDSSHYGNLSIVAYGETPLTIPLSESKNIFQIINGNVGIANVIFDGKCTDKAVSILHSLEMDATWPIVKLVDVDYRNESESTASNIHKEVSFINELNNTNAINQNNSVIDNNYVVIFSGGGNPYNNGEHYYDTLLELYFTITNDLNIPVQNIYLLYADGTNELPDQKSGDNSDLTFAVNQGSYVDSATGNNLRDVFTTIEEKMTSDSHLLFLTYDHGRGAKNDPDDTNDFLVTWETEDSGNTSRIDISGSEISEMLFQIQEGYITLVFGQCYSGGILDDIFDITTGRINSTYKGNAQWFGMAAANHYENSLTYSFPGGEYSGFIQSFHNAINPLKQNINETNEVFEWTKQDSPFTSSEEYLPNEGTWSSSQMDEHPWAMGESFDIFSLIPLNVKLDSPVITVDNVTDTIALIQWQSVQNAYCYRVEYSKTEDYSEYQSQALKSSGLWNISELDPDTDYYFRVIALSNNTNYNSDYSQSVKVHTNPRSEWCSLSIDSLKSFNDTIELSVSMFLNKEMTGLHTIDVWIEYNNEHIACCSAYGNCIVSPTVINEYLNQQNGLNGIFISWDINDLTEWNKLDQQDIITGIRFNCVCRDYTRTTIYGKIQLDDGTDVIHSLPVLYELNKSMALDIDGNGDFDATDITLLKRYRAYYTPSEIINGIVLSNNTRSTADSIYEYIAKNESVFDVDGNGVFNATDMTLLKRYRAFGQTESLTDGINFYDCSRDSTERVGQWIMEHVPTYIDQTLQDMTFDEEEMCSRITHNVVSELRDDKTFCIVKNTLIENVPKSYNMNLMLMPTKRTVVLFCMDSIWNSKTPLSLCFTIPYQR